MKEVTVMFNTVKFSQSNLTSNRIFNLLSKLTERTALDLR